MNDLDELARLLDAVPGIEEYEALSGLPRHLLVQMAVRAYIAQDMAQIRPKNRVGRPPSPLAATTVVPRKKDLDIASRAAPLAVDETPLVEELVVEPPDHV